jgi:hypothetical protein
LDALSAPALDALSAPALDALSAPALDALSAPALDALSAPALDALSAAALDVTSALAVFDHHDCRHSTEASSPVQCASASPDGKLDCCRLAAQDDWFLEEARRFDASSRRPPEEALRSRDDLKSVG